MGSHPLNAEGSRRTGLDSAPTDEALMIEAVSLRVELGTHEIMVFG